MEYDDDTRSMDGWRDYYLYCSQTLPQERDIARERGKIAELKPVLHMR